MPWTGSAPNQTFQRTDGTRSGATVWQEADAAGRDIVDTDHDTHDEDVAKGLNLTVKKDGGNTPTANLPMGGNRHTNVGNAAALNEYATFSQAKNNTHAYMPTVAGTANAITLTSPAGLAITAYAAGQTFYFKAASANTGAVTVNIDGLGVKTIKRFDGTTELLANDIRAGAVAQINYDGTNFQLDGAAQSGASADILARITPVGSTIWWGLKTIPAGYLKLTGTVAAKQSILIGTYPELDALYLADSYPYGQADGTHYNLPPAAERYIRAADADADIGTTQENQNKAHTHPGSTVAITDPGHTHTGSTTGDKAQVGGGLQGESSNTNRVAAAITIDSATTGITATPTIASDGGSEARPQTIYQYLIMLVNPSAAAASGVGLFGHSYSFDAATADADPGSGKLRFDNATLASVTKIYVDDLDAHGADVSGEILTWDDSSSTLKGRVRVSKVGAPANFVAFDINGATVDATGYLKLSVAHVDSNGSFAAGESISVEFFAKGDKGDTGATGASGSPGGSDKQIQYNTLGSFGGMSGTSWDDGNRSLTLTGATVTTSKPLLDMSQTWNGAVTYTGLKFNATDTLSNAGSKLLDLQTGGTTIFSFSKDKILQASSGGNIKTVDFTVNEQITFQGAFAGKAGIRTGGNSAPWFTDEAGLGVNLGTKSTTGNIQFAWGIDVGVPSNIIFAPEGTNTLALRNLANANTFRLYAKWTDASNYKRLALTSTSVAVETAGAEADNSDLTLTPSGTGGIVCNANTGTPGTGTTATEYGDSHNHITKLSMAGVLPDIAGGVAEAEGLLIYTFPAGVILVDAVHMDVGITQTEGFINADTPDVGIGSVIATGAVSVLGGTAGFEDYVTGQTAVNCTGTKTDKSTEATAGGSTLIEAGGAHTVHFNAADIWAANGDAAAALSGDVWIAWRFLGA